MLNRFYILSSTSAADVSGSAAGMTIAHVVHCGATANLPLLRYQFSSAGNFSFCLALRGAGSQLLPTVQALLLLFFHPYYEYAENGKTLFIDTPPEQRPGVRERLGEVFRGQGLHVAIYFTDEQRGQITGEEYYRYCLNSYSPNDLFLVESDGEVIASLQAAVAGLEREHPVFYRLADEVRHARQTIARLCRDKAHLQEENDIHRQLLDLSSQHSEVNYILRFYKNEYEILPLWYKRIGHIIKVLQGKRSFRSLYDKRIKKYKA